MGKRKVTYDHPKHVQDQCDVWLTAKVPPKQPVLRRLPLSIIQRIYPGPTVDVPNATKQTTLLDFFKKPRESVREESLLYEYDQQAEENHKPGDLKKGCSQNRLSKEDHAGYFDALQDGEMNAEPPTKQLLKSKYPEPTIVNLIDTSASHQQDENRMFGSTTTKHSNHKFNSVSGTIYRQQSATSNNSDVSTSRRRIVKSSNNETLPQSDHESHRKSDCSERQKCEGTDKGNDSLVYEYSSAMDSSHLSPSSGLSQRTDSQSCNVTFVPLKRVKNVTSSLGDTQTEEVSSPALWNFSGPCDRYKKFPQANNSFQGEESSVPPAAAKAKKLQYINPHLLDTEMSHTQFTDDLGESNMLTDSYPSASTLNGRVLRVNIVDSELVLNSCSIGESTEGSQWSRPNLSVDDPTPLVDSPPESLVGSSQAADDFTQSEEDPTLFVDQPSVEYPCLSITDSPSSPPWQDPSHSPADFSEFTLNTQGCFVPKEPAHGTSPYEEDSQDYD